MNRLLCFLAAMILSAAAHDLSAQSVPHPTLRPLPELVQRPLELVEFLRFDRLVDEFPPSPQGAAPLPLASRVVAGTAIAGGGVDANSLVGTLTSRADQHG